LLEKDRDFSGADAAYQKAVEANPYNASLHYRACLVKLARHDLEAANFHAGAVARLMHQNPAGVAYLQGRVAEARGDRDQALDDYERALRHYAEHVPSLIGVARVLVSDETRRDKAQLFLKRA